MLNSLPGYESTEEEEVAYPTPHILILKAETRIPGSLSGLAKHRNRHVVLHEESTAPSAIASLLQRNTAREILSMDYFKPVPVVLWDKQHSLGGPSVESEVTF